MRKYVMIAGILMAPTLHSDVEAQALEVLGPGKKEWTIQKKTNQHKKRWEKNPSAYHHNQTAILETLPTEIIEKIAKYLPARNLLDFSSTSTKYQKLFRSLDKEGHVHPTWKEKKIVVNAKTANLPSLNNVWAQGLLAQVHHVTFKHLTPQTPLDHFGFLTQRKHVDLSHNKLGAYTIARMVGMLDGHVETLDLCETAFNEDNSRPVVEQVDFKGSNAPTTALKGQFKEAIETELEKAFKKFKNLRQLNLSNNCLGRHLQRILRVLEDSPLERLYILNVGLSTIPRASFDPQVFQKLPKLRIINVRQNGIILQSGTPPNSPKSYNRTKDRILRDLTSVPEEVIQANVYPVITGALMKLVAPPHACACEKILPLRRWVHKRGGSTNHGQ